jgi:hypothetical protein
MALDMRMQSISIHDTKEKCGRDTCEPLIITAPDIGSGGSTLKGLLRRQ